MTNDDGNLGETEQRLLKGDAELILGVLAVVSAWMLSGDADPLADDIRDRLHRDGAISTVESLGEAAFVVERLCDQMHYTLGAYGDERPESGPVPSMSVHMLGLPDRDRALECLAELSALTPSEARIVDSRDNDPRYSAEVAIAFPGLPPDREWIARRNQLDEIARRHGGRWVGTDGS